MAGESFAWFGGIQPNATVGDWTPSGGPDMVDMRKVDAAIVGFLLDSMLSDNTIDLSARSERQPRGVKSRPLRGQ